MKRSVGTDLHAFTAADAAREKVLFIERAWRTKQALMAAFAVAGVGVHQRDDCRACDETRESAAAAKVGAGDLFLIAKEAELQAAVRACADTVHAHETFSLAPGNTADRIVAALAVE